MSHKGSESIGFFKVPHGADTSLDVCKK